MNNKTVKELNKAAKDQGLCGYAKLTKAELIARLSRRNDEDSDDDVWVNARGMQGIMMYGKMRGRIQGLNQIKNLL